MLLEVVGYGNTEEVRDDSGAGRCRVHAACLVMLVTLLALVLT